MTVSEKDDTITQRVKFEYMGYNTSSKSRVSSGSVSVSYLDVSISGKNGSVTGTVKCIGGTPPNTSMNVYLQSKTTGKSYSTEKSVSSQKFSSKKTVTLSKSTGSKTKFWRVYLSGTFLGKKGVTYSTNNVLFNKKASKYPSYSEPYSGKKLWVPPTNLKVNQVKRASNFRKNYLNDFKKKYPLRYGLVNWTNYEIHHMRPLKYGGNNLVSNGIALTKSQHSVVTSWWRNY